MIKESLKEFLISEGADLVGFSKLNFTPIKNQEELVYAITVAVKLPDAVLKTIENKPTMEYFHEYRTANALLDRIVFLGSRFLEKQGYKAFPIGASQSTNDDKGAYKGTFPHKTGARLSGLGFIGKNALFISEKYGSKVRLATILTDFAVEPESAIIDSKCGSCELCKKACPAGAITGAIYSEDICREDMFIAEKCSNHMKNYKDIGRGSVCGLCIRVCPFNKLSN